MAPDASNLWQGTDSKQGPPCSILIRLTGSGGRRFAGVAEDWVRRAGRLDAVVVRQSTSSKRKSCTGIHSALTPGTEAYYIKDIDRPIRGINARLPRAAERSPNFASILFEQPSLPQPYQNQKAQDVAKSDAVGNSV